MSFYCWEPNFRTLFIDLLPSNGHGADHTENTSCDTFSIVACAYFGHCLEMGLLVTICLDNYEARFCKNTGVCVCVCVCVCVRVSSLLTVELSSQLPSRNIDLSRKMTQVLKIIKLITLTLCLQSVSVFLKDRPHVIAILVWCLK
jgi:membrane protease subunit (stomatin/prohibitin family)